MFFNWYLDNWWVIDNGSCVMDGSVNVKDLETVLRNGLVLDHLSRIEDDRADEPNVGKVVSNFANISVQTVYINNYY